MLSAAASREKMSANAAAYGIGFLPLAFSGHLAHLMHEFLGGGIYDLLGYLVKVWDSVFKERADRRLDLHGDPFVSPSVVTFIAFLMVAGGVVGSMTALVMIARRLSTDNVFARVMPHMLLLAPCGSVYLVIFTGTTGAPAAPPHRPPRRCGGTRSGRRPRPRQEATAGATTHSCQIDREAITSSPGRGSRPPSSSRRAGRR